MRARIQLSLSVAAAAAAAPFVLVASASISFSFWAFAAPAHGPLSWDDCVRLTRENNPNLKAAAAAYEQAAALKTSAWGPYFPQLTLNIGGSHTFTESSATSTTTTATDSFNATANLTQNLFNGFGDEARLEQAKQSERAAHQALLAAKAAASQQLKTAFANLQFAMESLKLSDEIIKRRENNLQLVELRFEGGRENKGSLLLSKAYLTEAKYNRLQAEVALREAEVAMSYIVGLENFQASRLKGRVPVGPSPADVDLKALAMDTPDFLRAIASEEQGRAGVTVARSALLPSLDFTASAGKQDRMFFPQGDLWSIGLALTIPVFDGASNYYALRAAHAGWTSAIANRHVTESQVVLRLTKAYNALVQAVEKAKVDIDYLEAARTRAEIARHKYNNGLLTFDNWDLVESDLVQRQRNALISQRDHITAEANWELAQGKGAIP